MSKKILLDAIKAVHEWREAGYPPHSSYVKLEAKRASRALMALHEAVQVVPGVYWRGTNRRTEHRDVAAGVQVLSRNHATGQIEEGMSVSTTLATIWAYRYRYCYKVSGTMVGYGSDGEPILQNVRPIGRIIKSEVALAKDKAPARWASVVKIISDKTGEDPQTIDWLWAQ